MKTWMTAMGCVVLALVMAGEASAAKGGGKRAKAEMFRGQITAVDAGSVTILIKKTGETKKFALNADTKIRIETAEVDEAAAGNGKKQPHKTTDGKNEDLKVGQLVVITANADGDAATDVLVSLAKGKGKKGGEAKPDAPAPAPAPTPVPAPEVH